MPEDFGEYDEKIGIDFQPKFIQKIVKIGEVRSLEMNLYEVNHRSENDPRISLSRDSFRLLARYGIKRALILFISQNSLNYRLSLVTIDLKWEEGKRVKREYSNPRRYSFFLGPETKTHTPETYLIKKGRVKDFDDLKERFSLEIVNKDFYTQIAILFTKLAGGERTIGRTKYEEKGSLQLPSTSDDTLKKEFSVRLIGRLIFCWFLKKKCSDKGTPLLPEELLSSKSVTQKPGFYHNILEPLFFETLNTPIKQRKKEYQIPPWSQIPFLNGGLFANEYNDYYEIDQLGISKYINTLKVPDSWLKELFEIFEIYNFTIDENTSVDVELSIEPEMLGRIFENLLAEINPETGNTARKATGSYYTPRPIVEYMVDESLKQYLLIKVNLDERKISSLLAYEEEEVDLSESEKDTVLDALDVIKIIDPACGSGAFPMGILQKMLLILQKIDPESKKWLKKKVSQIENTIVREEFQKKIEAENWNYVHKLDIIQNSIYGVDIQPIAVDISKLRFFLSLIVDEKIDDSKENRGIYSLPNLEFKFVCANSLIGLPNTLVGSYKKELQPQPKLFEAVNNITELKKLREEYLRCVGNEKKLIEKKFQEIQSEMFLNSLNWGGGDSQTVKLSQWNPFSGEPCEWFDPEWMFGVKEGFDIAIANPPYYLIDPKLKRISKQEHQYYRNHYLSFHGQTDILVFFYEKSFSLLRSKGILTFISKNRWYNSPSYKKFCDFLCDKNIFILDFDDTFIFEGVGVTTNILTIRKNGKSEVNFWLYDNSGPNNIFSWNHYEKKFAILKSGNKWNLLSDSIILKMQYYGEMILQGGCGHKITPGNYFKLIKIDDSIFIPEDDALRQKIGHLKLSEEEKKYIFPFTSSGNIFPYYINVKNRCIFYLKEANIKSLPNINNYFSKIKSKTDGHKWFEYHNGCGYRNEDLISRKKKIIFPGKMYLNRKSSFYLDEQGIVIGMDCSALISKDNNISLKYVLGILNSKLIWYYIRKSFKRYQGRQTVDLEDIPVLKAPEEKQIPFIEIVNKILAITRDVDYLQNEIKQAKSKEYEYQIDQMVYKIYGLTDDEIKIVENFHKKV